MKNQPKLLAVLTAAALSAGCASGGGSGGGGSGAGGGTPMVVDTAEEQFLCMLIPLFCLGASDAGSPAPKPTSASTTASAPLFSVFTSWSEPPSASRPRATGPLVEVSYTRTSEGFVNSVSTPNHAHGRTVVSSYGQTISYEPTGVPFYQNVDIPDLRQIGQPGIQVGGFPGSGPQTSFVSTPGPYVGVLANPHVLGWNYQSFGVWDAPGRITAQSFGAGTVGPSAVPTNGAATFSGKLSGLYVSATGEGSVAAADLAVSANFSTRSLAFASSGTTSTQDLKTAKPAPHLNLSGTLTYAPGSNFTGTLKNAGGSMTGTSNGQFYGPAAQELGGIFALKSPTTVESFTGAYGAKR